jgi:hypothetical protein
MARIRKNSTPICQAWCASSARRQWNDERAERPDGGDHAQHLAPPRFRDRSSGGGQPERGSRAGQRHPDQTAGDDQGRGASGRGHDPEPDNVDCRTRHHRGAQSEAVCDSPDRCLRQAPDNILHGDGESEIRRR